MCFKKLWLLAVFVLITLGISPLCMLAADDVPVLITIGQSNADGSAFFNADEDARLNEWYSSGNNPGKLKIWYRSSQVQNQASNALNEAARWVIDGAVEDVAQGWLDLWYRMRTCRAVQP